MNYRAEVLTQSNLNCLDAIVDRINSEEDKTEQKKIIAVYIYCAAQELGYKEEYYAHWDYLEDFGMEVDFEYLDMLPYLNEAIREEAEIEIACDSESPEKFKEWLKYEGFKCVEISEGDKNTIDGKRCPLMNELWDEFCQAVDCGYPFR